MDMFPFLITYATDLPQLGPKLYSVMVPLRNKNAEDQSQINIPEQPVVPVLEKLLQKAGLFNSQSIPTARLHLLLLNWYGSLHHRIHKAPTLCCLPD